MTGKWKPYIVRLIDPMKLHPAIASPANVRMILQREPPEGLLDLRLRSAGLNPQGLVRIQHRRRRIRTANFDPAIPTDPVLRLPVSDPNPLGTALSHHADNRSSHCCNVLRSLPPPKRPKGAPKRWYLRLQLRKTKLPKMGFAHNGIWSE